MSILLIVIALVLAICQGFVQLQPHQRPLSQNTWNRLFNNKDDNDPAAWDADVDYDKELPNESSSSSPDPSTPWDDLTPDVDSDMLKPKLGINIDLEPLTEDQAKEIKKEAQDIINKKFQDGIDDIEIMRSKMTKEMEKSRAAMNLASELNAKQKSKELMNKIDKLTNNFLDSTESVRTSTKMAAAASKAMEGSNRGIEMGTWGSLGGRTVLADSGGLLGSVQENVQKSEQQQQQQKGATITTTETTNRIFLIADTKQDKLAKALVPVLVEKFESLSNIPDLDIEVVSPTSTMPLGGNNAACVLVFCTSLSQASSLKSMLDRLLRKTLQPDGKVGSPPTQLVGITTVGTERTDTFPYSLQNMLGKLDQRRQVEEALINTVQNRITEPPLDYTLIKMSESFKEGGNFKLFAGDSLDEATSAQTAASAIVQAVAFQPFARNATMCLSGSLSDTVEQEDWDTLFLPLEGPEIWRSEEESIGDVSNYDQLVEYVREWASLLADRGKGLTTPVMAVDGIVSRSSHLVTIQDGVRLLFLPTNTGKNYLSKDEERAREKEGSSTKNTINMSRLKKEGGIDVVVEVTKENQLRVRARRCNYADDAVIKELSEETILKRLQDAMEVWKKEQL